MRITSLDVRHVQISKQTQQKIAQTILGKVCYLGGTLEARGGAVDSVMTKIRSGQSKFGELVSLLASRGLPLGAKTDYIAHLYAAFRYMKVRLGKLKNKM